MDETLDKLITAYTRAATCLFPKVADHLAVSLPITNIEWACLGVPLIGQTADGIKYRKHGYGVDMDNGTCQIDIDLGDQGQFDGFDAWRLFAFAEENGIATTFNSYKDIAVALDHAMESGKLNYSEHGLYYRIT
jgi:hypothetical protein